MSRPESSSLVSVTRSPVIIDDDPSCQVTKEPKVGRGNPYVRQIYRALHKLTEPVLGPIRRFMPDLGGLDFSPVIVLFGLQVLKYFIAYYAQRLF